jgi:hypothetical protein
LGLVFVHSNPRTSQAGLPVLTQQSFFAGPSMT